ncbi:ArsR family transcriptional regulator [bacterium]|nr:MAG: ArsR family transcriptional regulator [bacterium]
MISNKSEIFPTEQQQAAAYAKALSHPARIAILRYLAESNVCITGDITDAIPLGRTTVLQHLQVLKDSELIRGDIDGKRVCYCINSAQYDEMKQLFDEIFKSIKPVNNCC